MLFKNKKFLLLVGIAFFGAFTLFTLLVKTDKLVAADFNVMVKIQDHIPAAKNKYLEIFSFLARAEVLGVVLIALLLVRRKIGGLVAAFLFGFAHLFELFFKIVLHQPPPPFLFYRGPNPTAFAKNFTNAGSSYPSGHSFRALFVAIIFTYIIYSFKKLNPQLKLVLSIGAFTFAVVVAVTKLSLGEHWPTDIGGGILLALSFGLISLIFI